MICPFRSGRCSAEIPTGKSHSFQRGTLFVLLIIAIFGPLAAQDKLLPVFDFNRLTTANGLPSNKIRSNVVRDRQGLIWFGTENGLARYDGYACKVYPAFSYTKCALILDVDTKGRLWVGTFGGGLSLYDPTGDRFVNFSSRQNDSTSLQGLNINTICEDKSGIIWLVGDRQPGIVWLDLGTARNETNADSVVRHARFHTMYHESFRDGVWYEETWDDTCVLATTVRGLFICNRKTNTVSSPVLPPVSRLSLDTVFVTCLFRETPQRLWIGTLLYGLYLFDQASGSLTAYHKRPSGAGQTRDDHIQGLQADRWGRLWVYCDSTVDLFDPSSGSYQDYVFSSAGPGRSSYTRLSVDSTGILWIPTANDGVYFLPPASFRFPRYALKGSSGRPMDMETLDRWSDGTYWVGAQARVARIRLESLGVLETVDLFKGEMRGLEHAGIQTSYDDGKGTLWYGTGGLGLYRFEPKIGGVKNFRSMTQLAGPFRSPDNATSIIGDGRDSLWIAGCGDGILSFDTRSGTYSEIPHTRGGPAVHIMKDREGIIWISDEARGLLVFDPSSKRWENYEYNPGNPLSIRTSNHQNTYQDPRGRVWIGCDTLSLWKPETRSFKHFPNPVFGAPSSARPIGYDRRGRLWVQYGEKGLALLDPEEGRFVNFDYSDGVIRPMAMSLLPDGRVILAGYGGMNIVIPDSVFKPQPPPPFVITKVSINDTASLPLQSISAGTGLRLRYDEDVLEFGFAAIDPGATHLIDYLYRLEGFENAWVHAEGRRFVRYPGLSPGKYLFRVKAVNRHGRWPDQEIALAVLITPPWWRTTWAYGAYVFLILGLLSAGYRVRLRQIHLKQEVEMEHFQREHLAEVDRLKSRFFANISHEFRTPLTLILGPIQKWREQTRQEDEKKDLSLAERNAHRLLGLINQLLDLSKLEAGAMTLRATRMDIVPLVKGIAYSFESSAARRGIGLTVSVEDEKIEMYCDKDMLEKILGNLLSNALKFTQKGGSVSVSLRAGRSDLYGAEEGAHPTGGRTKSRPLKGGISSRSSTLLDDGTSVSILDLSIVDTGMGIPPGQLDRVFDRFYQVDASQTRDHEGSGLGLALVKELVELHHGTIHVISEVGKGTRFSVRLPLGRGHLKDDEIVEPSVGVDPTIEAAGARIETLGAEAPEEEELQPGTGEKPIVLIIEDNADVRGYIKDYLVPAYQVTEARDGTGGTEKAKEMIPDLIISDVMMPGKDGFEVCRTLKLDEKTSHIPIILLTAKAASENKIEGLETGADDYLIKPFDPRELLARVRNLIDQRRKLRERFKASMPLRPGEIAVTSMDDAFLKKVMAVVELHMGEEGFRTDELCALVGMSRSQLHRKLSALTNQPPGEFIRYIRLHRAMDLLQKGAGTVSEIAYQVGFSDPSYFSKCFRRQFGKVPTDVRNSSVRHENSDNTAHTSF